MKSYPLVFRFHDVRVGKGFLAGVKMDGRVLLTEEDDGDFWMFGVQPGGLAGGGCNRDAAFTEFKVSYLSVLHDIAAESETFEAFKQGVSQFFVDVNEPNVEEWDGALAEVRKGKPSLKNLKKLFADGGSPSLRIECVTNLSSVKPAHDNLFGQISKAA